MKISQGITLIETLIYITLLSFIMIGIFSSVYMLMGNERREQKNIEKATAELILEKYHE